MCPLRLTVRVALFAACAAAAHAQSYSFTRLAGMPPPRGFADGAGSEARFDSPGGVALDATGNLYVADVMNHAIRKVTPGGVVTTFAGIPGVSGSADGSGASATFNQPWGITVDRSGNIWVADSANQTIRKITPTGDVTTFAGEAGVRGSNDALGRSAHFNNPVGVAVDAEGYVYVADRGNRVIRKITPGGLVSTLAGLAGASGNVDGIGGQARFNAVGEIALDTAGNIYVPDSAANVIRKITPAGAVTTLAGDPGAAGSTDGTGSAARFNGPRGVAVDAAGNVYVADSVNDTIRKVTPQGATTLVAGMARLMGNTNGTGSVARFFAPTGIAVDAAGNLFVADTQNHAVREISSAGMVTLLAGGGGNFGSADGSGSSAQFSLPQGIALTPGGKLLVTDTNNATIRSVAMDGQTTTFAGKAGAIDYVDQPLTDARFGFPFGLAVDAQGYAWTTDAVYNTVRRISPAGLVQTYAGIVSTTGGYADGRPGVGRFSDPRGIAVDSAGNVYVADSHNQVIRKITTDGYASTLAGSPGLSGSSDGTGVNARFNGPNGLAVGGDGSIYVADTGNNLIRKVTPAGVVTTLAGSPGVAGAEDGLGSAAHFFHPYGVAVDAAGVLYVTDTENQTIRQIRAQQVTTIGGEAGSFGFVEGTGSAARFYGPSGIMVDAGGVLYVVDSVNGLIVRGALDSPPQITTQPQSATVRSGTTVVLSVTGTGGGLAYQWEYNGTAIPGATASTYSLPNVQPAQAGAYRVTLSNSAGSVTSSAANLAISSTARVGRISNLAIRSQAGTGDQTLIVGFTIGGAGQKALLIRGVGPTLASRFGVPGVMADPMLEIVPAGSAVGIFQDDDWNFDAQVAAVAQSVGAFPLESAADAALYQSAFAAGGYTAQVSGKAGGTGVALAEIYDATAPDSLGDAAPRLTNVSARSQVGTGDNVLIAGFVIAGDTSKKVLIRAVGPTLARWVAGTLADPKLELFNSDSVRIQENDDWGGGTDLVNAFNAVGAFALDGASKDAALVATLEPGSYTAQVSGVGQTTGVALVEVYELP